MGVCNAREIKRLIHEFIQRHALPPLDIQEAKQLNDEILLQMEPGLKEKEWTGRFEYTGSSYEDTKVNGENEIDILRVQERRDITVIPTKKPGFFKLKCTSRDKFVNKGNKLLSTKLFRNYFKGDIQKILNENESLRKQVKISDHGPAVQLDVYKRNGIDVSHSTDLVPAIEVKGRIFIAKESKRVCYWRESFSVQEKVDLRTSDKPTLRLIKAIRARDSTLKMVPTYAYKNAVLNSVANESNWEAKDQAEKLLNVMTYMQDNAAKHFLPSHYISEVNLLHSKTAAHLDEFRGRLKNLSRKPKKLKKILET